MYIGSAGLHSVVLSMSKIPKRQAAMRLQNYRETYRAARHGAEGVKPICQHTTVPARQSGGCFLTGGECTMAELVDMGANQLDGCGMPRGDSTW